jgi:hypothetical protein
MVVVQISSGSGLSPPNMDAWRAQMQAKAFKGLDSDGSGGVSLAEFQARLPKLPPGEDASARTTASRAQASLESAFKAFDADGDGQVSGTELGAAMQAKGHHGQRPLPPPHARDGTQRGGSLGSALTAQLLGQGQAVPGTEATASAAGITASAAGQARQMLMRYAFAQGGGATPAGTSLAA